MPIYYLVALVIAIIGYYLSSIKLLDDDLWFARSGSLIVVLGVFSLFTLLRDKKIAEYVFSLNERINRDKILEMIEDDDARNKALIKFENVITSEKFKLSHGIEKESIIHQAIILISGTLIWGFGDLFIRV